MPNGLEYRQLILPAQNAIPIENGLRFHGNTPVCVPSPGLASLSRYVCSPRVRFTGRMLDATKKAICVPEHVIDFCNLEIVGRVGDSPIHEGPGEGSRHANPSKCWHSVYGTG
jgi:hypothetical protein